MTASEGDETTETYTNLSLQPSEVSFDWEAELLDDGSSEVPPRLRLELTNTATESVGLRFGPTPPFSTPTSGTEESTNRLVLFHPDMGPHTAPENRRDGCWKLDDDSMVAVNAVAVFESLDPNERTGETYALYNVPDNESCFPDGTFRFTDRFELRVAETVDAELGIEVTCEDGRIESVTTEGPEIA